MSSLIPLDRLKATERRLSECIASAAPEATVVFLWSLTSAATHHLSVHFLDPSLELCNDTCVYLANKSLALTPFAKVDRSLIAAWKEFQKLVDPREREEALAAWRLDALDRICGLYWDQQGIQSSLQRARKAKVATTVGLKFAGGKTNEDALQEEEALLETQLECAREIDAFFCARCDAVPGAHITISQKGEKARVAFFRRQRRWIQARIREGLRAVRRKAPGLTVAELSEKLQGLVDKSVGVIIFDDFTTTGSEPKALDAWNDQGTHTYIPAPQDVDLLFDWELQRQHQALVDAGWHWVKWLQKPYVSRRVASWRKRASMRCLTLNDVIARCKRQLVEFQTASAAGAEQVQSDEGAVQLRSAEAKADEQRLLKAEIQFELNMARSLVQFYRMQWK